MFCPAVIVCPATLKVNSPPLGQRSLIAMAVRLDEAGNQPLGAFGSPIVGPNGE
jgi:hypothetical protein